MIVLIKFAILCYMCHGWGFHSLHIKKSNALTTRLQLSIKSTISLDERSHTCLDFSSILNELYTSAVTVAGKKLASSCEYTSAEEINAAYQMVTELTPQLDVMPIRSSMNVWDILHMLDTGTPPERDDIVNFASIVEEVREIVEFLTENRDKVPSVSRSLASDCRLPDALVEAFDGAFDEEGYLSAEKYPHVAALRKRTVTLEARIVEVIKRLLSEPSLKEKLADSSYVEMEGRYCIVVKNTYKKGLGIVHGASNTGRSIYVEPTEVVQPTNDLKLAQMDLAQAESAVFTDMCRAISRERGHIQRAMNAIGRLDVLRAKAQLGYRLHGVVPEVGQEGTIRVTNARHPVLLLRGIDTVGNDIELSKDLPGLVISGPNAGGKTIVLKTVGLLALMCRHAIPVPARDGARVDVMDVMADIGDMQTVSGDLSTFSGHLLVCNEMLTAAEASPFPLVLLDEIGTGTDPAQGAVLAQAVLERLISSDSRVIVTTHYTRIKELAAAGHGQGDSGGTHGGSASGEEQHGDDGPSLPSSAFRIAAMEFLDNRPTYRLRMGSVGESFALEAAQRMGLPSTVLERAESLLDDETRRLVALQLRLEEEVAAARAAQAMAEARTRELDAEKAEVVTQKEVLEAEVSKLKDGATDEYLKDIRAKERELEALIVAAREAAAAGKTKAIQETKRHVQETRIMEEKVKVISIAEKEDMADPLVAGEPVEEGTTLVVLEKGMMFGTYGRVTRRNKGRGRVLMKVNGVEIKYDRHLLGIPRKVGLLGFKEGGGEGGMGAARKMSSADRRLYEQLESELVDPNTLLKKRRTSKEQPRSGVRLKTNTLYANGLGMDELKPQVHRFMEKLVDENSLGVMFIDHGEGKSAEAVKSKVRTWLKRNALVRSVRPASKSEGGDAFTFVELDLSE